MKTLPLGLDIGAQSVSIAQYELVRGKPRVVFHASAEYATQDGANLEAKQVAAIQSLTAQLPGPQHECIISLPAQTIEVTALTGLPRRARDKDVLSHAEMDAESSLRGIPALRRIVAISPTADPTQRMLSIGDRQPLDEMLDIVTRAGLRAVACDVPIAVWQRMFGGTDNTRKTDALLDLSGHQAVLYIFPGSSENVIGRTIVMSPGINIDGLKNELRRALNDARIENFANIDTLTVYTPDEEVRSAVMDAARAADEALSVSGLVIDNEESPPWAYAVGLGTWPVATHGYLRANLIKQSVAPWDVVRRQLVSADFARSLTGLAAGAGIAIVYGFALSIYQHNLESQAQAIQAKITALSPKRDIAQQYVTADEALETIDREAKWLYVNGQTLALNMAYIGNAVPSGRRIWLTNLSAVPQGWTLQGHGASIDDEALFIQTLARVQPTADTRYGDINHSGDYMFNASITNPTPSPIPTKPPAPVAPDTTGGVQ